MGKRAKPKTRLRRDEEVLRDGAANLQRGIETAGGWLYLTTHRLIFEAHAFNIQSGATIIPLGDVEQMWKCWTKFLGFLPIFPNSLAVSTAKGRTFRFVLGGRDAWITAVRDAQEELDERRDEDEEDDDD
jgi:hypothetical protein